MSNRVCPSSRGARAILATLTALAAPAIAGCGAEEPAARTEALGEVVPEPESSPVTVTEPAHAAIPDWVPSTLRERIGSSRLPVMLPRAHAAIDTAALSSAEVLSMDRWVSARIETSTFIAVIFGTDAHHEPPRGASFELPTADTTVRGTEGYVYENEGLFYAQWSEDGLAWDVEIDCLGTRCEGSELATSIAESLEPVGGVR